MFKKQELIQKQKMSAYQKKALNNIFLRVIEWLEKYVEINHKDEFPDWQSRKQIHDNNIERTDIYQYPKRVENTLSSQLHLFASVLEGDATPEFREELKQEFYKWINAVGIDVKTCPEKLKHFIFGINEVFEKGREKIGKDIENRKREVEMDSPEYMEQLARMFSDVQAPMRERREMEKSLEGKNPNEVKVSGFDKGNNEQGEQVFKGIAESVADSHQNFYFVEQKGQSKTPQQWTSSEIVQDVKKYPRNWRFDEIIAEYNVLGGAKEKKTALIHYSAQVGYDGAVFGNQPVYLAQKFSSAEIAEINQALNISQSSSSTNTQQYSKSDLKEIQSNAGNPNKDNKVGTIATVSIFSALLIGGVILVARNKLKKVKK